MNFTSKDDLYMGEWLDDKMHGVGVIKYADGSTYTGKFLDNQRDEGVHKFTNGDEYAGSF